MSQCHISEMSYSEGLAEVVDRLKLFVKKDYDIVYEIIGGHLGSYHVLLKKHAAAKCFNRKST